VKEPLIPHVTPMDARRETRDTVREMDPFIIDTPDIKKEFDPEFHKVTQVVWKPKEEAKALLSQDHVLNSSP